MPNVLVHGDWRIENVDVADDRVVAIFDWDSVCVEPEARRGRDRRRARSPVDWERPPGEHFPSDAEIAAFVAEYEDARGTPFTADERMHVAVEMVAGLAYGARCEHSDRCRWCGLAVGHAAPARRAAPRPRPRGPRVIPAG